MSKAQEPYAPAPVLEDEPRGTCLSSPDHHTHKETNLGPCCRSMCWPSLDCTS
jgi:hypothetical protein